MTTRNELGTRVSRSRAAVIGATAQLLTEGGLGAATIDAIRDRSGVSKTTIYKHWPNRLCVAIDAFADRLALDTAMPDTGTAREDLTQQIRTVSAFYSSPVGSAFAGILSQAAQDEDARAWLETRLADSRQHGIHVLWQRAVLHGEVRSDLTADLAFDILFGPLMWRLVTGRQALDDGEVDALVASVLV
ncbi:TetR/AcrR family transcriptional regulator [Agreia sp.]|uniref:TetR/AcrR family transcriptional regulator n=1 Tax=Agreia sp. TaxID=1872416 RepID=UPI0035BC7928